MAVLRVCVCVLGVFAYALVSLLLLWGNVFGLLLKNLRVFLCGSVVLL